MKQIIKKAAAPLINFYYRRREKMIIPPYEEKREIILSYKKKFSLNRLIETGTFLGDTIFQFRNDFKSLASFELSAELAEKAKRRFEEFSHIEIISGDSAKLLHAYIAKIQEPCLFWLDGHYSSEFFIGEEYIKTAKGDKETPILEELNAILLHPIKNHVILIDDARCFTGQKDYPSIKQLRQFVNEKAPHLLFEKKRDIIRLIPESI